MRPEARVWRKETRRDRRGRTRRPVASPTSAKLIRRIQRFHEARMQGLTIEEAAGQLNLPLMEAWRFEDFITSLADDLKGGAR